MGKHLFDTRAVSRIKMRYQDLGSQESYLSEKEWVEFREMMEILKCPHAATVAGLAKT